MTIALCCNSTRTLCERSIARERNPLELLRRFMRAWPDLYVVTAGSATLVAGSDPGDVHVGTSLHISQGDMVIIPENTPHWFSAVDGSISHLSMHMPRPSSAK